MCFENERFKLLALLFSIGKVLGIFPLSLSRGGVEVSIFVLETKGSTRVDDGNVRLDGLGDAW